MATANAVKPLETKRTVHRKKKSELRYMKKGTAPYSAMQREFAVFIDKMRSRRELEERQLILPGFEEAMSR